MEYVYGGNIIVASIVITTIGIIITVATATASPPVTRYDTLLLVDDSACMAGALWQECIGKLRQLVRMMVMEMVVVLVVVMALVMEMVMVVVMVMVVNV